MSEISKIAQRARKRNWPPAVLKRIVDLVPTGASAPEIRRQLLGEVKDANDVPSLRTVQDIVAEYGRPRRSRKPSEPWSLADADADEVALVMPVWREVVEYTEGKVSHLTTDETKWIVRIRQVTPEPYPQGPSFWQVYLLAREYVLLTQRGKPTTGPDTYLAFAPWRSMKATLRYRDALKKGLVPSCLMPVPEVLEADTSKETAQAHDGEEDTNGG